MLVTTDAQAQRKAMPPPERPLADANTVSERIGPAGLRSYHWAFSRNGDRNFDQWPDAWIRHRGPGYPNYVGMEITPNDWDLESRMLAIDATVMLIREKMLQAFPSVTELPPSVADIWVDRCLTVDLNGGLARADSPRLPASRQFQYQFSVDVRTRDIRHDRAFAELVFLDETGEEIRADATPSVRGTQDWTTLSIDRVTPPSRCKWMYVRVRVDHGEDGLEDIKGEISFDNIRVEQFPQLTVTTDRPFGLYPQGDIVGVNIDLMGLPHDDVVAQLQLTDQDDRVVRSYQHPLSSNQSEDTAGKFDRGLSDGGAEDDAWSLRLTGLEPGHYRLDVTIENDVRSSLATSTTVAVLADLSPIGFAGMKRGTASLGDATSDSSDAGGSILNASAGEQDASISPFGFVLPQELMQRHRQGDLDERQIANWLNDCGVGWAKLPVWFSRDNVGAADAASILALALTEAQVRPVGMLDQPPSAALSHYRLSSDSDVVVAALFQNAARWRPELDAIMNRMTIRIHTWQLGSDQDASLMQRSDVGITLDSIATALQGFGQPIEIVIPWPWLEMNPPKATESWKTVQRFSATPLTAVELDAALDRDQPRVPDDNGLGRLTALERNAATPWDLNDPSSATFGRLRRWVSLSPLDGMRYRRNERIADLMLRMATMQGHRVQAGFVSRSLDDRYGVAKANGRPGELMLPWRTTARLLEKMRNIGSLQLHHDSQNIVFESDDKSLMMVWADSPRTEELFLGDQVHEVDAWGRIVPVPTVERDGRLVHQIHVDSVPRFIVGIDPMLARFRMSVSVDRQRLDSLLGESQAVRVMMSNPVGSTLSGDVSMLGPPAWRVSPRKQTLDLLPRRKGAASFGVVLGNNATIGEHELPLDFQFDTVPPTRIRVYRRLSVGPEGFDLNVTTRLIGDRLRVVFELTNETERAAEFDCLLFASADRQYQRRLIAVGPGETLRRTIDWPRGRELRGKTMLLRAVQQEGRRVINHRFEVP
ncbi:MAG: hypothetical protein AAGD07_04790 [Planctomycetota bacterium]